MSGRHFKLNSSFPPSLPRRVLLLPPSLGRFCSPQPIFWRPRNGIRKKCIGDFRLRRTNYEHAQGRLIRCSPLRQKRDRERGCRGEPSPWEIGVRWLGPSLSPPLPPLIYPLIRLLSRATMGGRGRPTEAAAGCKADPAPA